MDETTNTDNTAAAEVATTDAPKSDTNVATADQSSTSSASTASQPSASVEPAASEAPAAPMPTSESATVSDPNASTTTAATVAGPSTQVSGALTATTSTTVLAEDYDQENNPSKIEGVVAKVEHKLVHLEEEFYAKIKEVAHVTFEEAQKVLKWLSSKI